MPVEFDDQSLRIIGNDFKALRFYDDSRNLQAEIYLDANNNLNIGAVTLVTGNTTSDGTPTGVANAQYLTLAAHADLAGERVFAAGSGLSGLDGGPNATYTLAVDSTVVRTSRTLTASTGLQGGGTLAADRSFNVDQGFAFTWTSLHTFNAGVRVAAGQNLQFGTDVALSRKAADILQLASGDSWESNSYSSGISGYRVTAAGDAEFNNVLVRGEFAASVFRIGEISATAGTHGTFYSAAVLQADVTTPGTLGTNFTFRAKNSADGLALLSEGIGDSTRDRLRIKAWNGAGIVDVWLKVIATGSNTGPWTEYTVRQTAGSVSTPLKAGMAIADYGPPGKGFITLSADGTVGPSANMTIATHDGADTPALTLRARLGNLNGSYGTGANDRYGIGIGDFSSGNYLSYNAETVDEFKLSAGGGVVTLDGDGLKITLASTFANQRGIQMVDGSTLYGSYQANIGSSINYHRLQAASVTGMDSQLVVISNAPSGKFSYVSMTAVSGVTSSGFEVRVSAAGEASATVGSTLKALAGIEVGGSGGPAATGQIVLDQGTGTGEILTLRSTTSVAHGMTTRTATETYGYLSKFSATAGGLQIGAWTEDEVAFNVFTGYTNDDTGKATTANAAMQFDSRKKSGTTTAAPGANANMVAFRSDGGTRFIFDTEGDSHQDVGVAWTNFSTHDDAGLLTALSVLVSKPTDPIRGMFGEFMQEHRQELEALKLVTFNDDGHHFVNMSKLLMLTVGAAMQNARRVAALESELTGIRGLLSGA